MTATVDFIRGRWVAYHNGIIGTADTRAALVRELRAAGWNIHFHRNVA